MGKIYDGLANFGQVGRQSQTGYPVLWRDIGVLGRAKTGTTGLARDRSAEMRRTLISAAIGIAAALVVVVGIDATRNLTKAIQFAELQNQQPSDWLLLEKLSVLPAEVSEEPRIKFTATPLQNLLVRLNVSPRNSETGAVVCSGGGHTRLYPLGIPVNVNAPISRLAGLDACVWEPGRYRIRLTFSMTEQETQVSKVLLVETEDVEVLAFDAVKG